MVSGGTATNTMVRDVIVGSIFSESKIVVLVKRVDLLPSLAELWLRAHARSLPGDRVQVELTPYDLTRGRIVYRYK